MRPRNVELHIEQLVLHGFSPTDGLFVKTFAMRGVPITDLSSNESTIHQHLPLRLPSGGVFLGETAWVEAMRERLAKEPELGIVPPRKRLAWCPSAAEIVQVVRRHFNVASSAFSEVRRHRNEARVAAISKVVKCADSFRSRRSPGVRQD